MMYGQQEETRDGRACGNYSAVAKTKSILYSLKAVLPSRLMVYVSMLGSGTVSEGKETDNGNNNTVAVAVLHWSWCSLEDVEEIAMGRGNSQNWVLKISTHDRQPGTAW